LNFKTRIRVVSFCMVFLLLILGAFLKKQSEIKALKRQNYNSYSSAVDTLCNGLYTIHAELEKASYAATAPMLLRVSAEINEQSGMSLLSLSHLPIEKGETDELFKLLSQSGDYAMYIAERAASGAPITSDERKKLIVLSQIAGDYAYQVDQMRISFMQTGKLELSLPSSDIPEGADREETEEYPTLIYDGPYSDHILTAESKMLSAAQKISNEKAQSIAAEIMNIKPSTLRFTGETGGKLASYHFEGEDISVSVTQKGGYVLYFRKYRTPAEQKLSVEDAAKRAEEWLESHSGKDFMQSYYFAEEGVLTVNFAYREGEVTCYTDLIKVGVSLSDGEIVLCEAAGYIMNHSERELQPPKNEASAAELISDNLEIENVRTALIPSGGNDEILCYEFLCKNAKGREILVYINCETLLEEQIYIVLKTPGGTLTK